MDILNLQPQVIAALAVHAIGALAILFECFYIMRHQPSRLQLYAIMLMVSGLVYLVGYCFELVADDIRQAMNAIKIQYLGQPFTLLFIFLFVMELCSVDVPRWVKLLFAFIQSFISFVVFTCDMHSLYYTSYGFEQGGFAPHIVLGHAPLYYIYTVITILYLLSCLIVGAVKWHRARKNGKETIPYITVVAMIIIGLIGFACYSTGITNGYDTSFLSIQIGSLLLGWLFIRYRIFDTLYYAKDQALNDSSTGFVFEDTDSNIVYVNKSAKEVFQTGNDYERLAEILNEYTESSNKATIAGRIYSIVKRSILYGNRVYGQAFEITDITENMNYVQRLESDIEERTQNIKNIQRSVTSAVANIIEARDDTTGKHIKNTIENVERIAVRLSEGCYREQLSPEYISLLKDVAPMHDIGKIAIPDVILNKPGKLTKEEFDIIKKHSVIGAELIEKNLRGIESNAYVDMARDVALYHHENWNGKGYPCGLSGAAIPLSARIMAVADAFDALCQKRPYKDAYTPEQAMEILKSESGTRYDPEIIKAFIELRSEQQPAPA